LSPSSPHLPAPTVIQWDCPQVSVSGWPILQWTVLLDSAYMESSIHHLNPLATTMIRADTDVIWVGLNSNTLHIPDSMIIFRNLPDPGWSTDNFSDSGQILPLTMPGTPTGTDSKNNGPPGHQRHSSHNNALGTTFSGPQYQSKNEREVGQWQKFNAENMRSTSLKSKHASITS